jgi:hypothetical protein
MLNVYPRSVYDVTSLLPGVNPSNVISRPHAAVPPQHTPRLASANRPPDLVQRLATHVFIESSFPKTDKK